VSTSDWPTCCHVNCHVICRTATVTCPSACHVSLPRQLTSPVPRVTLSVVTRVTSDTSNCTPNRPNLPATCHSLELPHVICTDLPRVTVRNLPRQLYGPATSAHDTWTVRTAQSAIFFACLTFRTERDIFSIRSPFDKVNIPPESGRRDRRNGIGFVAFRALSFLSIFQALSGFWIRFRITPPHKKTFWSPKGY
jgi:hypothetical protein